MKLLETERGDVVVVFVGCGDEVRVCGGVHNCFQKLWSAGHTTRWSSTGVTHLLNFNGGV